MANANAWISAANSAVQKAVQARKAIEDNSVDYSDLGRAAIRAEAAEAVDAVEANLAVGDAVLTEGVRSKLADVKSDLTNSIVDIRKNERKAGMLAAGAGLVGAGYILKNRKVDPNPMVAEYDLLRSKYANQISQTDLDIIAKKQALADIETQINNLGSSTTAASNSTLPPNQQITPVATGDAPAGSVDRGTVFNYLTGEKKLSRNQALGLMANIDRESSFRIAPPGGDGGNSFGMLQWNNTYGRSDLMKQMVPDYQTNWKGQLDHALSQNQLPEYNKATSDFLNTDWATPQAAADAYMRTWEIPADPVAGSKKHAGFLSGYSF
jgi:hypothetical protein